MQEAHGNLWDFVSLSPQHIAVITTNGFVKRNGECVMGKGCAREARDRFPGLALEVGDCIRAYGNVVSVVRKQLVTFPTKHVWWERSDLELIAKSAAQLGHLADLQPENIFYLPRPGCGNGGLCWEDVLPVLEAAQLPDNVVVISQ